METHAFVISHTHWDREWYRTFEGFRNRLVFLMDELIEELEAKPEYRYFHLDGQTIVLEDYLEIRPGMRERLSTLIRDGRIIIGPWYVMPDEFLVSGESLVRNLARGVQMSRDFGAEPMRVGYVVDIFGHNSQFPQILQGFAIDSALLYRGIGDYPHDLFKWVGADGSQIWAAKLDNERSYSNFYFALRWPFEGRERDHDEFIRRAEELLAFARERSVSNNLLMMDGVDHQEIEPELPVMLDELNNSISDTRFESARLTDYIDAQKRACPTPEEIHGELYRVGRKGINNQLLKNVLSSMVHLKQANDECEMLLTRWDEPFEAALSETYRRDVSGFLAEAWRLLLVNHPHDSICGCSITRVHEDNVYRFNQVRDIGEGVLSSLWGDLADDPVGGTTSELERPMRRLLLFNAGQREVSGVIEATLVLPPDSQGNLRLYDQSGTPVPFQILDVRTKVTRGIFRYKRLPDFRTVNECDIAFEASVPAVGFSMYRYEDLRTVFPGAGEFSYRAFAPPNRFEGSMRVSASDWETDHFRVRIDRTGVRLTHTASGREVAPLCYYEDGGDYGDGWVYRKPVRDRIVFASLTETEVVADGPLVLSIAFAARLEVPVNSDHEGRSDETKTLSVRTVVTLRKDSSLISFATKLENSCTNHRLRVVLPLGLASDSYATATPFALQRRIVGREDAADAIEWDCGVVPSQGITTMRDETLAVGVYARGLYEVEVLDTPQRAIALTLFRSFTREVGKDTGEMSLMHRQMSFEYALDMCQSEVTEEELYVRGSDWRCGVRSLCPDANAEPAIRLANPTSIVSVTGDGVVLSSYRRNPEGTLLLRVFNVGTESTEGTASIASHISEVKCVTLDEERNDRETSVELVGESAFSFRLRGAGIATFAITVA